MTAKQLYSKTMAFNYAKLMLGIATIVISIVLFGILMGIGWLFGDGVTGIMLLIWIGAVGVVRFALMHYMGYLVKAGHIAVLTEAIKTGKVPDNQVEYGKGIVKERFATSNIYFAIDSLISGAVKQIQSVVDKAGDVLDFIPGMDAVTGVAKLFISISLGYIDECCLGYTFYNKDQNAFKSAADGVVIYAQNWKSLLKNAAKTTLAVILSTIGITLVVFVLIGGLFRLLDWNGLVAFILAVFVAWAVKFAFIDSWILVKTMSCYMEVAPDTKITFDLYDKLSGMSSKFKELFQKSKQEQPVYAGTASNSNNDITLTSDTSTKTNCDFIFCGACGEKNEVNTKFCGSCGAKL